MKQCRRYYWLVLPVLLICSYFLYNFNSRPPVLSSNILRHTNTINDGSPYMSGSTSEAPAPIDIAVGRLFDGFNVGRKKLEEPTRTTTHFAPSPKRSTFPVTSTSLETPRSVIPSASSPVRPQRTGITSEIAQQQRKTTYVLTGSFGGQMTRAVKNMMMEQCWAGDFDPSLAILEPFSHESELLHTTDIWKAVMRGKTRDIARFSDFFDLELYNNASLRDGGAPVVTWEDFLLHAPRRIIAIVTPPASCGLVADLDIQVAAKRDFSSLVKFLQRMAFKMDKIIPINCHDRERSDKLQRVISEHMHNSTILLSTWRNYNVVKSWLTINKKCDMSDKYPANRLKPSPLIKKHTLNYRKKVLGADKTIAIMIRVERFLTLKTSHRSDETVDSCLVKTLSVYSDLTRDKRWAGSQPFLTVDIGRYGSGLMQSNESVLRMNQSLLSLTKSVTKFLMDVYGGKWKSLKDWEESFVTATEGVEERGYVAMLQREIAVGSDCLVLMGGGSFQEVAANHYLQRHPNRESQCLRVVCAANSFTNSVSNAQHQRKNKKKNRK